MTTESMVTQARAYVADRRAELPKAHELAVALVDLADQFAKVEAMVERSMAQTDRAIDLVNRLLESALKRLG